MDKRKHDVSGGRVFRGKHHLDAGVPLVQNQCVQDCYFHGYFCLGFGFCRKRLGEFRRCAVGAYSAYQDFAANGAGQADTFMMGSLNESAKTPFIFLFPFRCGDGLCFGHVEEGT